MKAQLISPQFLFNLHEHQKSSRLAPGWWPDRSAKVSPRTPWMEIHDFSPLETIYFHGKRSMFHNYVTVNKMRSTESIPNNAEVFGESFSQNCENIFWTMFSYSYCKPSMNSDTTLAWFLHVLLRTV